MSYIKQILEATPHRTTAVQPLFSHLWNHLNKTNKTWWRRISDVLLSTPSRRHASVGWSRGTYLQQLCTYTGFSLKDLPGAMDDRNRWKARERERESGKSVLAVRLDNDDDDDDVLLVRKFILFYSFTYLMKYWQTLLLILIRIFFDLILGFLFIYFLFSVISFKSN